MEDLLIHGDSVYDIIDKQDHGPIQAELGRNIPQQTGTHHHPHHHHNNTGASQLDGEQRIFLCRMNVSRNARRQMRFGDQKVVLVQGHYLSYLPLCSRNEPVFLATCTPIAMPETRECVVQGATTVFTTVHSMDMKIVHVDKNGEFHLGYNRNEIQGSSWYQLLHWDYTREAQTKHRLITQSEQDRSCILLIRMQRRQGDFIWVHAVLQVRDGQDTNQQPVIVCTNQVLSDREASVMVTNSWLYHYYSVQSKIQFGLPYEGPPRLQTSTPYYHSHPHPHPHHHNSPTLHTGLSPTPTLPSHSGYVTSHHVTYGYHSPVGIPQHHNTPSSLIGHHNGTAIGHSHHISSNINNNNSSSNNNNSNNNGMTTDYHRSYSYRIDTQPVDYSQTPPEVRCSSTNSTNSSTNSNNSSSRLKSPPSKRRAISRLEPLYIPESQQDLSESTLIELSSSSSLSQSNEIHSQNGQTVLLTTVIPSSHRNRLLTAKSLLPSDPPDFIEQWNPSPPWSETAQKVPDITHHELSPYLMTTTPPTPTSAPPQTQSMHGGHTNGAAFSFDWMPEQFVPIMDYSGTCVPCLTQDGITVPMHMPVSLQLPHWPTDHRLLPLQPIDRRSEDDSNDNREERRSH